MRDERIDQPGASGAAAHDNGGHVRLDPHVATALSLDQQAIERLHDDRTRTT